MTRHDDFWESVLASLGFLLLLPCMIVADDWWRDEYWGGPGHYRGNLLEGKK